RGATACKCVECIGLNRQNSIELSQRILERASAPQYIAEQEKRRTVLRITVQDFAVEPLRLGIFAGLVQCMRGQQQLLSHDLLKQQNWMVMRHSRAAATSP